MGMVVGIVGYSPASVNIGKPLIERFKQGGYLTRKIVLSEYAKKEWGGDIVEYITEDELEGIDILFYNTGSGHSKELDIPITCNKAGVISVHVMDIFWEDEAGYRKRLENIPNYCIVMTEENKKDVIRYVGMDKDNVLVLGNPHYDRLKRFDIEPSKDNKVITFITQCGEGGTYREPTSEECKEALLVLKEMLDRKDIEELKVYKHPRETTDFFIENNITIEHGNEFENMIDTDILVSCGSTPYYEANILGVNTIKCSENLRKRILNKVYDERWEIGMGYESGKNIVEWVRKECGLEKIGVVETDKCVKR